MDLIQVYQLLVSDGCSTRISGGNENQVHATEKVDTSASDVTTLVRSAILDMFVPQIEPDVNAPAPVIDPEKVRMDDFRAQMARLGIGNSK